MRSRDSNMERNVEILRNEWIASDKTLDSIATIKSGIESTLRKYDLAVLQEFNKRDEEANEAVQMGDREREKLREQQVKNPLRCVDTTLLDEELDRLMGDLQSLKLSSTIPKS